jgi:hypothetical protein
LRRKAGRPSIFWEALGPPAVRQPRGNAKHWQAVVTRMVKVFGAPIRPQDEKTIVEYLSSAYGPAK